LLLFCSSAKFNHPYFHYFALANDWLAMPSEIWNCNWKMCGVSCINYQKQSSTNSLITYRGDLDLSLDLSDVGLALRFLLDPLLPLRTESRLALLERDFFSTERERLFDLSRLWDFFSAADFERDLCVRVQ